MGKRSDAEISSKTAQNVSLNLEPLEPRLLLSADQTVELIGLSPALFVENQGQWSDSTVRYGFQRAGASVGFTDTGPVFSLYKAAGEAGNSEARASAGEPEGLFDGGSGEGDSTTFRAHFVGANTVEPAGVDRQETDFNYYAGDNPANWRTGVAAYSAVVYPELYRGIELYVTGHGAGLKYEFRVAAGADPTRVAVRYDGIEGLTINQSGALHVITPLGELVDEAPIIYQEVDGARIAVDGEFRLLDGNTYTVWVSGNYDPSLELVIDPQLEWSSFLGGTDYEEGMGVAVDSSGNVFVTGQTNSDDFPANNGFDQVLNGNVAAFVTKISASGQIVWSTFVDGKAEDYARAIAVDNGGNAVITGQTRSSDWPKVSAFDTTFAGASEAFVTKLNSSGQIVWSSYLGGAADEYGNGIAVDEQGKVLVTGQTASQTGFPTANGFDTDYNGGTWDAFVTKLDAGGALAWSSYLGGANQDVALGVAADGDGNALLTGYTWSSDFPASGGFDSSYNGGTTDAFVTKVSADGHQRLWSVFLGGSNWETAYGVATDPDNNVIVTGSTASSDFPSGGGFGSPPASGSGVFIAKIAADGQQRLWSGFIDGSMSDTGRGVATDASGNIYVAGITPSPDFATLGGFDNTPNGAWDAFVLKIVPAGQLRWASVFGGSDRDEAEAIAVDASGNIFITGRTSSTDLPTPGGFDHEYSGATMDAFVAKISPDGPDNITGATNLGELSESAVTLTDVIGDGPYGNKDVDFFTFEATDNGFLTVTRSGPLSGYLRLFDSTGAEISSTAGGSLHIFLLAGTYSVGVSGQGNAAYDPNVPGSGTAGATGEYTVSFGFEAVNLPDLRVDNFYFFTPELSQTLPLSYTTVESGPGALLPGAQWTEDIWLTDDGMVDGQGWEKMLWSGVFTSPGARSPQVTMPALGTTPSTAGAGVITEQMVHAGMTVIVRLDTADAVLETSEANNQKNVLVQWKLPDLILPALVRPWAGFGQTFQYGFTSNAIGAQYLLPGAHWTEKLWLTDDGKADGTGWEKELWSADCSAAGGRDFQITMPALGGTPSTAGNGVITSQMVEAGMYLVGRLDSGFAVVEEDEGNNEAAALILWTLPDLSVGSFTPPRTGPGEARQIAYTIAKGGPDLSPEASWAEELWLTDDGKVDGAGWEKRVWRDVFTSVGARSAGVSMPELGSSASTAGDGVITAAMLKAGMTWVVKVDADGQVTESDGANNVAAASAVWKLPDLTVPRAVRPDLTFGHALEPLTYTVKNAGEWEVKAGVNWVEQVWLGTDENVLVPDNPAGGVWHYQVATLNVGAGASAMAAGETVDRTVTADLTDVSLPAGINVENVKWIVLVDWPQGATATQVDPAAVLESHELKAPTPGAKPANAFILSTSAQDIDTGALMFVFGGGSFTYADGKYSATGDIQIGFRPDAGDEFSPLLDLDGTLWYSEEKIHAEGTVTAAIGSLSVPIFEGTWEMPMGETETSQTEKDASSSDEWTIAGVRVVLEGLALVIPPGSASISDAQIEVQGKVVLPEELGGFELAIDDPNKIVISQDGVGLTGGKLTMPDRDFNLMGMIEVKVEGMAVEYVAATGGEPAAFKLQGKLSIPTLHDVVVDFTDSETEGERYIKVSNDGVDVVGRISAKDISLGGPWKLDEVILTFDSTSGDFQVDGTMTIPTGIQISAGIGFVGGNLNYVSLEADNLRKPIGNTGAFLQLIGGRVNHIADEEPISFGGSVGATAGPQLTVPLPSWAGGTFTGSLARLDVTADIDANHLTADGTLTIVGGLMTGVGTAELNWQEEFLRAEATFSALAGLITMTASFNANSNLDATLLGTASVTIPDIDEIPFLGGHTIASGGGYFQFRNDNDSSTDFVAGWGTFDVGYEITAGIRVRFNGDWDLLGAEEISALTGGSPLGMASPLGASATKKFHVNPGARWLLLGAEWANAAGDVPVQVRAPDGTVYDEADFAGAGNMRVVGQLSGAKSKAVGVSNPAPGDWSLILTDTAELGAVQFAAYGDAGALPTIEVTAPASDASGGSVPISYAAFDSDSQAHISLYYDRDRSGCDGNLIADGLVEADGPGTYVWDTTNVPTGDYYVYAVIMDESNPPAVSYSLGKVRVVEAGAPAQVAGVDAGWAGGDRLELSWAPAANASYYLIRYTSDAAGEFYSEAIPTDGAVTEAIVPNMIPGETYRLTVQAVDDTGRTGPASVPVVGVVGASATVAPGAAQWEVFADPGATVQESVAWQAGDTLNLVSAPSGASLDAGTGAFSWQAPQGATGWSAVIIRQEHTGGTVDVIRRYLFSQADRLVSIQGRLFDDLDADGQSDPGEPGLNGWTVRLKDASTGATLATQVTQDMDLDGNGIIDPQTERGLYAFNGLCAGTYGIAEELVPDWSQTSPVAPLTRTVSLSAGEDGTGMDFGNDWTGTEVVIGDGHVPSVVYTDADGTVVTVTHKVGTAVVRFQGAGLQLVTGKKSVTITGTAEIAEIALTDTTIKSALSFKAKGGNGLASVGGIVGHSPVGKLTGSAVDLVGVGIGMMGDGYIASAKLHDVFDGADIIMPGTGFASGLTFQAASIGDGTDMTFSSPLKTFKAAHWAGGALVAPFAKAISITGDKKRLIAGDLGADVTLNGADLKGIALGNLTVAGTANVGHSLTSNQGGISSITAGDWTGDITAPWIGKLTMKANAKAGLDGGFTGDVILTGQHNPPKGLVLGTFSSISLTNSRIIAQQGDIGAVTVKGLYDKLAGAWTAGFSTSTIVANKIGKASLGCVFTANGGETFGLIVANNDSGKASKISVAATQDGKLAKAWSWDSTGESDQTLATAVNPGDFHAQRLDALPDA